MNEQPLTRDNLARHQGGVWDYVSPSRLNSWLACPFKFRLKYVEGVRAPTSLSAFVGKAVHRGLESFYRHRQLGLSLTAGEVSNRFIDAWERLVTEEGGQLTKIANALDCQKQVLSL